jgi:hypothetical protein
LHGEKALHLFDIDGRVGRGGSDGSQKGGFLRERLRLGKRVRFGDDRR